jgi:hypothetical protein
MSQVIVGKPLYELQVDGNVQVAPAVQSSSIAAASAPASSPSSSHSHTRTPLIKFVGKRDRKKVELKLPEVSAPVVPARQAPQPKKPQTGVDFFTLKDSAWYGRPKLSTKEIEAIMTGGAV